MHRPASAHDEREPLNHGNLWVRPSQKGREIWGDRTLGGLEGLQIRHQVRLLSIEAARSAIAQRKARMEAEYSTELQGRYPRDFTTWKPLVAVLLLRFDITATPRLLFTTGATNSFTNGAILFVYTGTSRLQPPKPWSNRCRENPVGTSTSKCSQRLTGACRPRD